MQRHSLLPLASEEDMGGMTRQVSIGVLTLVGNKMEGIAAVETERKSIFDVQIRGHTPRGTPVRVV